MPPQDDIQPLLEKVKCKDLYKFLNLTPRATPAQLREAARKEFDRIQNQGLRGSPWDERKQLVGICQTHFRDDSSKEAYDRTLKKGHARAAAWLAVIGCGLYGLSVVGVVPDFGFWRSSTDAGGPGGEVQGPTIPLEEGTNGGNVSGPVDDPPKIEGELDLSRRARRRVQTTLLEEGFNPGPADGVFGDGTREALRAWQRARRLQVTGYLDREAAERLGAFAGPGPVLPPPPVPPPVDPGEASGTLNVRGDPSSSIEVDGVVRGVVPESGVVAVPVQAGRHFVVARREGYMAATSDVEVAAGRAELVDVTLVGMPGRLTVSADVAGAVLRIGGADERSLPVTDLEIPPGSHDLAVSREGYREVEDRVDVRPGQLVSLDFVLEPIPAAEQVRDALAPALAHFQAQDYRAAVDAVRSALDVVGDSRIAYWMLGVGLYELGEFEESVPPLARAMALGAEIVLLAKHRHGGGGFREGFCQGTLTLSLAEIAFVSFDEPGHGLAVAPDKVAEPTIAESVGGFPFRLNTSVLDPERGIERNNFDFVHRRAARQAAGPDSPVIVLGCPDCDASMHVQEALMTVLIRLVNR